MTLLVVDPNFDDFFRTEYSSVVRALTLAVGSRSLAEDAAQHGFYEALKRWRRVREMGNSVGWVYVVAVRFTRRAKPELLKADPSDELEPGVSHSGSVVDRLAIGAAVEQLTPRQRSVFVLRHVSGIAIADIAESLGIAEGTVRVLDHQAKAALRIHLSSEDEERLEAVTDVS